ncbi:hypothetical protein HH303_09140 [Rhodospirillaceae bacterium KN72]|uniref:Ankyrin repeat protein n=1 Tax=Pacificispira spongiicola TaxID=2729598 RepID=A0A7Y0HEF9_9PROT|nr:ankyrin repeat domain-containing protein [Pacificispira spongiicola]NMM44645.1 hypothetical protein [Pacificispira spongiicola]
MERTFWIQGRTGRYWQNLESLESDQTAIMRLGALISEDRYDELRLIQAQVSPISGETEYADIVTVRDGQVVDSPMLRAQAAAAAHFNLPDDEAPIQAGSVTQNTAPFQPTGPQPDLPPAPVGHNSDSRDTTGLPPEDMLDPDNHPQLRFWPTVKPEHMQGSLGLHGEEHWVEQDPEPAPHPASTAGRRQIDESREPAFERPYAPQPYSPPPKSTPKLADDEFLAGGWRIPGNLNDDGNPAPSTDSGLKAPGTETYQRRNLTADPTERRSGQTRVQGFLSSLRKPSTRRQGRREDPTAPRERKSSGSASRAALMSGVFAGALASGLALSAINPDFAGRVFAGISGQFGTMLPSAGLIEAIESGDLQSVRARLAEGVDPNMVDMEGNPALLRAARAGNLAAVSLLLQAGADPTLPSKDGRSVLHRVAAEGRSQALQRMIDAGAPVDLAGGVYGCLTPLSVAAANGRVRAASLLAERGAALTAQRGCNVGPIEIAAAHPHVLARLEQIRAEQDALVRLSGAGQATNQVSPGSELLTEALTAPAQMQDGPAIPGQTESAPALETAQAGQAPSGEAPSAAGRALAEAVAKLADIEPAATTDGTDTATETASVFQPPAKPAPPVAQADPRVFTAKLKSAIDRGDQGAVVALLDGAPSDFKLDEARFAVEDSFGSGVRSALEQAALHGQSDIVRLLVSDGASIPPRLIHRVVQNADRPDLAGILGVLLEKGGDPNAMSDGLTPLMRASLKGDPQTAYMLMAFGADPKIVSTDGRQASDYAREAGRADLEERLVLAASEQDYGNLMMGLSWSDTLASLRDKIEVCKDIGDDFTACKLNVDSFLTDAKVVVAQFDRKASDRLVAIQVDSRPLTNPSSAIAQFDAARRAIQDRIPEGHAGFVTAEYENQETLFRDLRPETNRGRYFTYWPDQDRRRPVFIHLKLSGLDDQHGFYRLVIGNPFRAS